MYKEFLKNISPREYQKNIFKTCSEKNCLVVLPTGLGKTMIALMLSIERIKKFPGEKVVFLAPTKPLAEQHCNFFKKNLSELFAELSLFTGNVYPGKRKEIWELSEIIFSTPQCIANDIRNNLYDLKSVCLLIEDESHRCLKNYDYNYIAQKYKEQAVHQRILGLTASPGNEMRKIKEICKNLSIDEVEIRTRESPDVKEYLQEVKYEKIQIDFPKELEEIRDVLKKIFNNYIEGLRKRNVFFGPPTKSNLILLQKKMGASLSKGSKNFNFLLGASECAQAIKIQHAIELIETQTIEGFNKYLKELFSQASNKKSKGVIKLVAKPEFNFAYIKSNEMVVGKIEHPKIEEIMRIIKKELSENQKSKIIIFTQFRDTASIVSRYLKEFGIGNPKIFVGQAKKSSIEKNKSSGLSQKEQKKIIEEFSAGDTNILCATCIAEEGLDIPEVNIVIFYEAVPSAIRVIQRAGRTARLSKGKVIMLITKKTKDEAYFHISRRKEEKMHSAIENVKREFLKKKETEFQKTL